MIPASNNLLLASADDGYNLTRSLRFRSSASAYLSRTPSVTGDRQKWTHSFWFKRGELTSSKTFFLGVNGNSTQYSYIGMFNNTLRFYETSGGTTINIETTQVFRDPSSWYHVVIAVDTTQATSSNRIKIYLNGSQITAFSSATYPTQNYNTYWGTSTYPMLIGRGDDPTSTPFYFDGYWAEHHWVNGQQLTPSSFGSTNALTGVWQPARYTGTYGTNGFYLPFTDNSALTTSSNAGLGKDFSGNGNYWTTNNISITSGVTYDSMTDVPTLTSATAANFAVLNPLAKIGGSQVNYGTLSNANLTHAESGSGTGNYLSTIAIPPSSGKFYFEITADVLQPTYGYYPVMGLLPAGSEAAATLGFAGYNVQGLAYYSSNTYYANNNTTGYTGTAISVGQTRCFAYDSATGKLWVRTNNGSWENSGDPVAGTNPFVTLSTSYSYFPYAANYQSTSTTNYGQRPFAYTPPTGYVALNTYNLPTSTIVKGNTVMDVNTWTGNGSTQTITNAAGFKPDFVWIKNRNNVRWHILTDSVRGNNKQSFSNDTAAEESRTDRITSFNSNGFSVGSYTDVNYNADTFVGWQWQAGQGSTSSNTNGTITSTVSVNASAGFSVVTYTGTGSNATVGHGLGVTPSWIIVKARSAVQDWRVYTVTVGNTGVLDLNTTNAAVTGQSGFWNNTSPTSSVFSVGGAASTNGNGSTYVAYCFAPITGFSAFGSYTGNGSTDGPFVYVGFRPKFVLIKSTTSANDWIIEDTARNTYNVSNSKLSPNTSGAEFTNTTAVGIDFLSNGFKIRGTDGSINTSNTYIYAAFAESPYKNSLAR
jgi:hypothetical protein